MVYCLLMTKSLIPTSKQYVKFSKINKHPTSSPIYSEAVADSNIQSPSVHSVLFETIDGDFIRRMALKSKVVLVRQV